MVQGSVCAEHCAKSWGNKMEKYLMLALQKLWAEADVKGKMWPAMWCCRIVFLQRQSKNQQHLTLPKFLGNFKFPDLTPWIINL